MSFEDKIVERLKQDFPGHEFSITAKDDMKNIFIDGSPCLTYDDVQIDSIEKAYSAAAEMAFDEFYGLIEQSVKMVMNK